MAITFGGVTTTDNIFTPPSSMYDYFIIPGRLHHKYLDTDNSSVPDPWTKKTNVDLIYSAGLVTYDRVYGFNVAANETKHVTADLKLRFKRAAFLKSSTDTFRDVLITISDIYVANPNPYGRFAAILSLGAGAGSYNLWMQAYCTAASAESPLPSPTPKIGVRANVKFTVIGGTSGADETFAFPFLDIDQYSRLPGDDSYNGTYVESVTIKDTCKKIYIKTGTMLVKDSSSLPIKFRNNPNDPKSDDGDGSDSGIVAILGDGANVGWTGCDCGTSFRGAGILYEIEYDANGGPDATLPDTSFCLKGDNIKVATNTPTRPNYAFVNWNTKANGSGTTYTPGQSYKPTSDMTLYAQWRTNTLTYNANGGSGAPDSQSNIGDVTVSSTKPTRTDYTFYQWNTKADGTGTYYASGSTISLTSGDKTLYAQWQPHIKFDVNGGSGSFSDITVAYHPTKSSSTSTTISTSKPTKSSDTSTITTTFNANGGSCSTSSKNNTKTIKHPFTGWTFAQAGTGTSYDAGSSVPMGGTTKKLYAQYGSETEYTDITLPNASKTNCTFLGWYTSATGGTRRGGYGDSYEPHSSDILYAHFGATITYNKGKTYSYDHVFDIPEPDSIDISAGSTFTPTSSKPSKYVEYIVCPHTPQSGSAFARIDIYPFTDTVTESSDDDTKKSCNSFFVKSRSGNRVRYVRWIKLTFLGWSTTQVVGRGGKSSDVSSTFTITGNTTLYGVWKANSMIVPTYVKPSQKTTGTKDAPVLYVGVEGTDGYNHTFYRLNRTVPWIYQDSFDHLYIKKFKTNLPDYPDPYVSVVSDSSADNYYKQVLETDEYRAGTQNAITRVSASDELYRGVLIHGIWDYKIVLRSNGGKFVTDDMGGDPADHPEYTEQSLWRSYATACTIYREAEKKGHDCKGWDTNSSADGEASDYSPLFKNTEGTQIPDAKYFSDTSQEYENEHDQYDRPYILYLIWARKEFKVRFHLGYGDDKVLLTVTHVKYNTNVSSNLIPQQGNWYTGSYSNSNTSVNPAKPAGTGTHFRRRGAYSCTGWSDSYNKVKSDRDLFAVWEFAPIWEMVVDKHGTKKWVPYKPKEEE